MLYVGNNRLFCSWDRTRVFCVGEWGQPAKYIQGMVETHKLPSSELEAFDNTHSRDRRNGND